jgi:hypothetical protein
MGAIDSYLVAMVSLGKHLFYYTPNFKNYDRLLKKNHLLRHEVAGFILKRLPF